MIERPSGSSVRKVESCPEESPPGSELLRALGALVEPPTPELQPLAAALELGELPSAAEHADLFTFQLYPYASVYLGSEGMLGGEARDRIAGFWRALGLKPPPEPDHLAVQLALQARLAELEASADQALTAERWRHARRTHLGEHLITWLPPYLRRVHEIGGAFYRGWADLLQTTLAAEADTLGGFSALPSKLHLGEAPALRDPRASGGDALLEDLLAPAKSGFVLLRDDLVRAARELDLGLRHAERRYTLRALLAQNAAATLGWLAGEARRQAGSKSSGEPDDPKQPLGLENGAWKSFWRPRAFATAQLLDELAVEAAREREI